jgi:hypothetical protein
MTRGGCGLDFVERNVITAAGYDVVVGSAGGVDLLKSSLRVIKAAVCQDCRLAAAHWSEDDDHPSYLASLWLCFSREARKLFVDLERIASKDDHVKVWRWDTGVSLRNIGVHLSRGAYRKAVKYLLAPILCASKSKGKVRPKAWSLVTVSSAEWCVNRPVTQQQRLFIPLLFIFIICLRIYVTPVCSAGVYHALCLVCVSTDNNIVFELYLVYAVFVFFFGLKS